MLGLKFIHVSKRDPWKGILISDKMSVSICDKILQSELALDDNIIIPL